MTYYNRYSEFEINGFLPLVPFVGLDDKPTDKVVVFGEKDSVASLSQEYYGSPYFEFLIRMKNSSLGSDEFEWEPGSQITIPYPLVESVNEFISKAQTHKQRY